MEQQQIKVSFSLGTKLLLSVVVLLLIVISFLDVSTILLFIDDKQAYTFQSQSTEALLAGRDFVNFAKTSTDTLRLTLASYDPAKGVSPQLKSRLKSIVDNQSELITVALFTIKPSVGSMEPVAQANRDRSMQELDLKAEDLEFSTDWMRDKAQRLAKEGYAFINLSRIGAMPLLGFAFADASLKDSPTGMPVALGVIPAQKLGKELRNKSLTILTRSGEILFDTNPTVYFSKYRAAADPLFSQAIQNQVASGASEFDLGGQSYLGSYYKPGFDTVILTRIEKKKAYRAAYAMTEKFILLGLMAVGAAIIFAILFSKTLTAPLQKLFNATKQVASGNFELNLESKSKDEIGALTGSFNAMSKQISELIKEKVAKVHLENELAIASTVQQTLFPPISNKNSHVHIHSHYQSASECGGDWWGFFGVGNKLCLMIADATGHGLPSALITSSARSCFSIMHKLAQEEAEFAFSPGSMLSYANRVIHDCASGKIMMTFFAGVIDFEQKTLTYASAGHNPPWLFKKVDGKYKLNSLTAVGQRLGEATDIAPYEEKVVNLDLDDLLFLYTDGLMEGKDTSGEMYGKKRTRKTVEANLDKGPEGVINALVEEYRSHNQGKALDDDITLAVTKILALGPVVGG